MKKTTIIFLATTFMILCFSAAYASHFNGHVYCDENNEYLENVTVIATSSSASYSTTTNAIGYYYFGLPCDTYTISLDMTTLPSDAVLINPSNNGVTFPCSSTTIRQDWAIDSATCTGAEPFCGDGNLDPGEECDDGNNMDGDGCSAHCTVETGGDGCTPGYWKNHLDTWGPSGLALADDFDTTFGTDYFDPDITLEQAVNMKGGGVKKIARHGTAALLNAMHPAVAYPATAGDVITAVQNGDVNGLVDFNELSDTCPAE